jgi:hypothetical protein
MVVKFNRAIEVPDPLFPDDAHGCFLPQPSRRRV